MSKSLSEPYTKLSVRWPEAAHKALKEAEKLAKKTAVMRISQGEILAHYFLRGLEAERRDRSQFPLDRFGVSA